MKHKESENEKASLFSNCEDHKQHLQNTNKTKVNSDESYNSETQVASSDDEKERV